MNIGSRFLKALLPVVAVLLLSAAPPAFGDSLGYIEGTNVNLRSKPSVSSGAVMQFSGGDLVKIIEKAPLKGGEKYPWIRVTAGDGTTGWVYGQFLAEGRLPPRFALADPKGRKLLFLTGRDDLAILEKKAGRYTRCVFGDGIFNIEFEGRREERPAWNGRETAQNFEKMGGLLFRVKDGPLPVPADSYGGVEALIAEEGYLAGAEAIRLARGAEEAGGDVKASFEKRYSRPLKSIVLLARGADFEAAVYAMEFKVQGKNALGAVALVTPEGTFCLDFPVEWDEQSAWHVDDEGNFYPENYSVGSMVRRGEALEFTLHNPAPESLTARLVITRGGKLAAPGGMALSRYASPE